MDKKLLAPSLLEILACPVCRSGVNLDGQELTCINNKCRQRFPIKEGIPIMLANHSQHHQQQQKYFDKEFRGYGKYSLDNWRLSYWQRISTALGLSEKRNGLYLDIGVGGSGYTIIEAARQGCRAVGLDLSIEGVKRARYFAEQELGERSRLCLFVVGMAEKLPFKNEIFSQISSVAVLEHVPDDCQAIGEIARVAKKDCRVFITVPNTYRRVSPFLWLPYKIHDRTVGHLRHYREEELGREFGEYDFIVKEVIYSGHLIKVLQILATRFLPGSRKADSSLWWRLEEADLRQSRNKSGAHLSQILVKGAEAE